MSKNYNVAHLELGESPPLDPVRQKLKVLLCILGLMLTTAIFIGFIFILRDKVSVELAVVGLNFIYVIIGLLISLAFAMVAFLVFDTITPFNTAKELDDGNIAVGIVIGLMFLGCCILPGLVIGLGLN